MPLTICMAFDQRRLPGKCTAQVLSSLVIVLSTVWIARCQLRALSTGEKLEKRDHNAKQDHERIGDEGRVRCCLAGGVGRESSVTASRQQSCHDSDKHQRTRMYSWTAVKPNAFSR